MTAKNVKVTLTRKPAAIGGDYKVTRITGRIVIHADKDEVRAGDTVNEKQAEQLNSAYTVTVTAA